MLVAREGNMFGGRFPTVCWRKIPPTQGLDPPLGRHVLHGGANEIVAMVGWATWQQFPKGSQIRIEGI